MDIFPCVAEVSGEFSIVGTHAVLFGEYELLTDQKHRLLVPSSIRNTLDPERDGKGLFVVIGRNRKPWFYATKYYEFLANQGEQHELTPDEDLLAFDQYHFARASWVDWDAQGRIVVPEKIISRTGMEKKKEVTLIGARDHLELWPRDEWNKRFDDLATREVEITLRAEMARQRLGMDSKPSA